MDEGSVAGQETPPRPGGLESCGGITVDPAAPVISRERGTAWTGTVSDSDSDGDSDSAGDIEGVHLWTFRPVPGGVLVTTEESWVGPSVDADVAGSQAALDEGLADWVQRLKVTAEALAVDPRRAG